MRALGRRNRAKQWARFALKCGLLLTDAKAWEAVNEQLRDRADDVREAVKQKYDDASEQVQDAREALQGRSEWLTSTASFLGGVGIGVGLGILFAPVSGEDARALLRDKAMDFKGKVSDFTAGTRFGSSAATGTDGD
jgi:gas vesicle protein